MPYFQIPTSAVIPTNAVSSDNAPICCATASCPLSKDVTYRVRGHLYGRLLFFNGDPKQTLTSNSGGIPMGIGEIMNSAMPFQIGLDDYPMICTRLGLEAGSGAGKELEKVVSETDGRFSFSSDLKPGKTYTVEATLEFGERVYPERIRCTFKVDTVPTGFQLAKVKVQIVHHIQWQFQEWKQVDKREGNAVIEGSVLSLIGSAALVCNTSALETEWMTQHLSPDKGKNPKTLNYHPFYYDNQYFRVPLHHLCLATCIAIILRYYDIQVNGQPVEVQHVAEAATRWYLDVYTKKIIPPSGFGPVRDLSAADIVKFTRGDYPHNDMDCVIRGGEELVKKHNASQPCFVDGGTANLMKTSLPSIKTFLGLGWPVILADNQRGNWEHARVCHGLVVDHKGKMHHMYCDDPWNEKTVAGLTDGSASDLGWAMLSLPLTQHEVSPRHLLGGGELPAPRRLVF